MFILVAIIMMFVGILLFLKARKMPKEQGLNIVVGICAIMLVILGAVLLNAILSKNHLSG